MEVEVGTVAGVGTRREQKGEHLQRAPGYRIKSAHSVVSTEALGHEDAKQQAASIG